MVGVKDHRWLLGSQLSATGRMMFVSDYEEYLGYSAIAAEVLICLSNYKPKDIWSLRQRMEVIEHQF